MNNDLRIITDRIALLIEKNAIEYSEEYADGDILRKVEFEVYGKKLQIELLFERHVTKMGWFKKDEIWYFIDKTKIYLCDTLGNPQLYLEYYSMSRGYNLTWKNKELEEKIQTYLTQIRNELGNKIEQLELEEQNDSIRQMISHYAR